jgi:ABC-type branched-subunit amino acid transport system substrate-binding protein
MRVGILNDMSETAPGPSDIGVWLRMVVDEALEAGRLDRDVEFVHAAGLGLPEGTAAAVEHAFAELVAADALLIVGPAIGDNALVATPCAERFRVPTINWAGTERARSEHMFHLQVGSHEDESIVLARHLSLLGSAGVGIVADASPIGRRYLSFFLDEAAARGLRVTRSMAIEPLADEAVDLVAQVVEAGSDSLVYLGLGLAAPAVAGAARAQGFAGRCLMNTSGMRGYLPEFARALEGWTYLDMHADDNETLSSLRARLGLDASGGSRPAVGFDMGRLVVEGLARAPELTRSGVREGLEQIKWLAAAEGHEGTLLGFGHQDRGALHGRYLVLRSWQAGQSVQLAPS